MGEPAHHFDDWSGIGRASDGAPTAGVSAGTSVEALNEWHIDPQEQNRLFHAAISNMSQGLCMFDDERRLLVCNDRYAEMYGLKPQVTLPGTPLRAILEERVAIGSSPKGEDNYVENRLSAVRQDSWYAVDELKNGRIIAVTHRMLPGGGSVSTHEDITDRRKVEAQIAYMAHHDVLTGLPNRVRFREQMDMALGRLPRGSGFAVLCLDLDSFKNVNDTLGHPVGDALLTEVGRRLRDCLREHDSIARLGGDEFAIIQAASDPRRAEALARRIVNELSGPYEVAGYRVVSSASVGVAMSPSDGTDADQLLRNADMALYRAKADGRGTFRFFELAMDAEAQARRTIEMDLRQALQAGEFEVHYQPLLDARLGRVAGVEALLRWHHPSRGLVPPDEFIPVAEEIGLITEIGKWVLMEACREVASWTGTLNLAVNLSPDQFRSGDVVESVVAALTESGFAPERLELEITESLLLQNEETTLNTLHKLKRLGVSISMDDFGTGYCSLSYLRSFPFDKIKIDRSFVHEMGERGGCDAIVQAIVNLGARLGIATTAEGVETEGQLEQLAAVGCSEVQGFLFSPALPGHEISAVLRRTEERGRQQKSRKVA
jgi:diguanylate cyclase (GGDEF)-like protein